jgi:1,4-dihydroxy-2-naphthoate octaprenyltransferase
MTPGEFMTGFIVVAMAALFIGFIVEAVQDYKEFKKIRDDYNNEQQRKKDWEAMTRKELPND